MGRKLNAEANLLGEMPRRSGTVPAGRTHFSPQGPLDVLSPWSESRLRHYNWSAHWHRVSQRGTYDQFCE